MGIDFSAIRRAFQNASERLTTIRSTVADLQRQRERILNGPIAREDLKRFCAEWIAAASATYRADFVGEMEKMRRNPVALGRNEFAQWLVTLGALGGEPAFSSPADARALPRALCAAFGPALKDAAWAAIDSMPDWPADAIPLSQRDAAVHELTTRIDKLLQEERELIENAAQAGIRLE